MVINGEQGTVNPMDVLESDILTASGSRIGAPLRDAYSNGFGTAGPVSRRWNTSLNCNSSGSQQLRDVCS